MPPRRRKTTWKEINKKRTLTHRLKLVALALSGILVSALFFGGFSFVQFLKSPLTLASGSFPDGGTWDNLSPLNLALVVTDDTYSQIESLSLLTADKYQKSISVVNLPVAQEVDYPLGLGPAPLAQALVLGDSLTPKIGIGMVEKVLKKSLAVSVSKYVLIKSSDLAEFKGNPAEFKEQLRIKNLPNLLGTMEFARDHVATNLSLGEIADLVFFVRGVDPVNIFTKDYTSSRLLLDLDKWWPEFFARGIFRQQRTPVLVLNGTNREGLGSWGGRLVSNMGGDTLTSINSYGSYAKTFIVTDQPDLPIVKALGRLVGATAVVRPGEGASGQEYSVGRAKVTLVLGLDSATTL
jgi:hypothetical protein